MTNSAGFRGNTSLFCLCCCPLERSLATSRNPSSRPSQANTGGIVRQEASLHISNVSIIDPTDSKPTRVGYRFNDAGAKERFSKRSGAVIA